MSDFDAESALVMPFVTVASKGGPHDDESFTAGWMCGTVYAHFSALSQLNGMVSSLIDVPVATRVSVLPQLDLIAMKHGYTMKVTPYDDEHAWVQFVATGATMENGE